MAGIASRRAAETLISQGRVSVNGRTVAELGSKADPAADDIRVDGRRVKSAEPLRYLLLHKPRGTSQRDRIPRGAPRSSTCCAAYESTSTRSAAWIMSRRGYCCSRTTGILPPASRIRVTASSANTKHGCSGRPTSTIWSGCGAAS